MRRIAQSQQGGVAGCSVCLRRNGRLSVVNGTSGDFVKSHSVQGWFLGVVQVAGFAAFELLLDPFRNFPVFCQEGGGFAMYRGFGGSGGGLGVSLGWRAHQRCQPRVAEEHVVGRSVLGVLVKTSVDECMCFFRESLVGESGGFAVDNFLVGRC